MNKLDQAREQVFYAELIAQLAGARQRAASERERLIRALGLWGGGVDFRLPQRTAAACPTRRGRSSRSRRTPSGGASICKIARIEVEALAKSYGLTDATRFINLLEVAGVSRTQRETGGAAGTGGGFEVDFQIPLFDFGEVRVRQAERNLHAGASTG